MKLKVCQQAEAHWFNFPGNLIIENGECRIRAEVESGQGSL